MTDSKSIWLALSASMLKTDNPLRRFCPIEVRRKFLISLSLLKDLSAEAEVTGNVRKIFNRVDTFGNVDKSSLFFMNRRSASSRAVSISLVHGPWIFSSKKAQFYFA